MLCLFSYTILSERSRCLSKSRYFKCHISDATPITYLHQNRYDMNFLGMSVSSSSSMRTFARQNKKLIEFFSVHIEAFKLQKRQTYQNNLHSELWDMKWLPESSRLKKFVKNTARRAGITQHQSQHRKSFIKLLCTRTGMNSIATAAAALSSMTKFAR